MPLKSDAQQWGGLARFFHWAVVLLILVQGIIGLVMVELPKGPGAFPAYNLHKSIGMTILALAALRLVWRAFDPHPAAVAGMPRWQVLGARTGHVTLYLLLFLVPLSGWWFDSVSGLRPMYWFGLFEVPHMVAPDPAVKELARDRHELLFWILVIVAAGHAAMALIHHFVNRDATLTRMLPQLRKPSLLPYAAAALFVLGVPALVLPVGQLLSSKSGGAGASAAPSGDGAGAAAGALARAWQVDAAQSRLEFKDSYSGEAFSGAFRKFETAINYDDADLGKSKFDVKVDTGSVDTQSSERDDTLKGSDFFDPKKFPQAHFVTTSFAKGADGTVTAQGTLTIRDQTRPVTLVVKFAAEGNRATLDVDTTLKRLDFGLGAGKDWADIGPDVPVHGHLLLIGK